MSAETSELGDLLFDELCQSLGSTGKLFERLDLQRVCEGGQTLARLQRNAQVKKLMRIFEGAGLTPRLGYNMGTGDLSLTCALEPLYAVGASVPQGASLVVHCMLGLLCFQSPDLQRDLERKWAAHQEQLEQEQRKHSATCTGGMQQQQASASSAVLELHRFRGCLANACLERFLQDTGVAVVTKKVNFRLRYASVTFDTASHMVRDRRSGVLYTDKRYTPLSYSPCYARLSGFNEERVFGEEVQLQQRAELVEGMVQEFWQLVDELLYFPDPVLKERVTQVLGTFLASGFCGEKRGFAPCAHKQLAMYLHGLAGIGKSQFVKVFALALRELLRRYVEPRMRVDIVRVPLNSITPANLRRILHIQGISDWSIERILEQTICKGGIVILHLEENPADPQEQLRLFQLVQSLLYALIDRYPEYASNVIYAITSNYPPTDMIASNLSVVVNVRPPCPDTQSAWCRRVLQHSLDSLLSLGKNAPCKTPTNTDADADDVNVNVNVADEDDRIRPLVRLLSSPPHTEDMRRLQTWKMCISFLAARFMQQQRDAGQLDALLQHRKGANDGSGTLREVVVTVNESSEARQEGDDIVAALDIVLSANPPSSNKKGDNEEKGKEGEIEAQDEEGLRYSVVSHDHYFYFAPELQQQTQQQEILLDSFVAPSLHSTILTVFDMFRQQYLKPAVLALTGSFQQRKHYVSTLQRTAQAMIPKLRLERIEARHEEHKEAVFGDPKEPSLGGLLRVIDQVTNPVYRRDDHFALVIADVNELGQFMLRELLEDDTSRTHRNQIYKQRIMFVMNIDSEAAVSPQLHSRAHAILQCDA